MQDEFELDETIFSEGLDEDDELDDADLTDDEEEAEDEDAVAKDPLLDDDEDL